MARKPSVPKPEDELPKLGAAWGEGGKMFPQLCSWLCDSTYEDGTPKGKVRVQVERVGRQVRVQLKCADTKTMVEAHHENLSDAVLTLELLLGSDDCPWVLDPYPQEQGPRKRK